MSTRNKIILFDGECNFCNASVQFVFKRDPKGIFKFASLQSEVGKKYLEKFDLKELETSTVVLIEDEWVTLRSTAALRIAMNLTGMWPILSIFILVPRFIRDAVYNFIAKRRHRLVKEKCELPTAEFKSRFID